MFINFNLFMFLRDFADSSLVGAIVVYLLGEEFTGVDENSRKNYSHSRRMSRGWMGEELAASASSPQTIQNLPIISFAKNWKALKTSGWTAK